MKIFLTGGTGFLGSRLVEKLLADGHTILLLARDPRKIKISSKFAKRISFIKSDLALINAQKNRIKKFHPEVAIHLAWEGIPSDAAVFNEKNVVNGLAVIKTSIDAGVKAIVMAGSCHEYGEPGIKVTEASPLRPYNALYAAKIALYWLGSKIAAEHEVGFIWLRPGFIYGPGQREKALIPHIVTTLKRGGPLALRTPNGGNDFIYVDDVVDALARAAKNYKKIGTTVLNVGSGRLTSVAEVVRHVYDELSLPIPRALAKKPRKIQGFWMDIKKIKKELNWQPRTTLKEGIKKTVAYFKNHA